MRTSFIWRIAILVGLYVIQVAISNVLLDIGIIRIMILYAIYDLSALIISFVVFNLIMNIFKGKK
jgi:hypothetical protein